MANQRKAGTKRLGGFELISKVGQGGMGVVYKARQISMNRIVAVKILSPRLSKDKSFVDRFLKEAQAVARLNHRNIVQGIDAGEAEGYFYFAMEYVDGETVHSMIVREGALEERLALNIARDTARALSHAHKFGIVHRDVKPGNIMVTKGGVTKLCDLGLAREKGVSAAIGGGQAAVGTPYYISPEQAKGYDEADIRCDIYSLGATLYRMIVGEVPFSGDTPNEILQKHVREPLPWPNSVNPNVSEDASRIIARMMAKNPEERYQSPADLQEEIERTLAGESPQTANVTFEIPPVRAVPSEEAVSPNVSKRKEALRGMYEIRLAVKEAAQEQKAPFGDIISMLQGNLDENQPDTFIKYSLLALSDGNAALARRHMRKAMSLGANVSKYVEKLNVMATPRGMVYVPAGEVVMAHALERKQIKCSAFYIDIAPVTNDDYARFTATADYPPPKHWNGSNPPAGQEDHPVVGVSWDDARAYAIWAGKDLPTDAQWLHAARGCDARIWPWGSSFLPAFANSKESGLGGTTPVGQFSGGAGSFGCVDMAGNVREWLRDEKISDCPSEKEMRLAAGGCWDDVQNDVQCDCRVKLKRDARDAKTGFRCARDL